jgi:outer membrane immunogenic protein
MRPTVLGPALAGFAAALALAATPAHADETRVEVSTSGNFYGGDYQQSIGAAIGHDFTLSPGFFAGPEVSIEKLLASDTLTSVGISGRVGANLGPAGKLYAVGGWASQPYHGGNPDWDIGAGYSHALSTMTYGKLEYRHYTSSANGWTPSRDVLSVGFGVHF